MLGGIFTSHIATCAACLFYTLQFVLNVSSVTKNAAAMQVTFVQRSRNKFLKSEPP